MSMEGGEVRAECKGWGSGWSVQLDTVSETVVVVVVVVVVVAAAAAANY